MLRGIGTVQGCNGVGPFDRGASGTRGGADCVWRPRFRSLIARRVGVVLTGVIGGIEVPDRALRNIVGSVAGVSHQRRLVVNAGDPEAREFILLFLVAFAAF